MATIKSYTDLQQSKKLAEILPLDSADMYWSRCTITDFGDNTLKVSYAVEPCTISQFRNTKEDVPCWSLSALLGVLPKYIGDSVLRMDMGENDFSLWFDNLSNIVDEILPDITKDNPIDACYEMILRLHELKML